VREAALLAGFDASVRRFPPLRAVDHETLIAMVQSELSISVPVYHQLGPHLFATIKGRSDLGTTSPLVAVLATRVLTRAGTFTIYT
jgi:hypothetical protein